MTTLKNFIDGQFTDSSSTEKLPVLNPADDSVISHVPLSNANDVDQAVKAGVDAFPSWSNLTIKARTTIMLRFHALVEKHKQELAELIVQENGKNITEALADVAKGNETVEWACSLPQLACGRILSVSTGINCREIRKPLGVVAAIVPFNFPFMVPMWTLPISLVMGNCVVLKPSEKVPNTMSRVCELFEEAGLPRGVFQIVHGATEVVQSLSKHQDIAAVTFVGSSKVADIVSTSCRNLNKRVLALGGAKNHLIAVPDCDVAMAAKDIVASFAGCCGQRCMAASVLVLVGEVPGLLDAVVSSASALQAGSLAGQVGPLIDAASKERVLSYINDSENDGVKVLLDGRSWSSREKGSWVGPTILLHSKTSNKALHDEIFGPVLSVIRVESWDEAIAIENGNPYGNAACIYTEKGAVAEWFTQRFRAAMLGVNIGIPVPREPFSFGGLYGTLSKFGDCDVTGDGAMEFFSNRIKITSKWSASYGTGVGNGQKRKLESVDNANFDGKM